MSHGSVSVDIIGLNDALNEALQESLSLLQDFADKATGGFTEGIFDFALKGVNKLVEAYQVLQPLYQEQIESEIRLQSVLSATEESAGFSSDQLQIYAEQMQNVIGVADHLILNTLAVQASFERIQGHNFQRAAEAAFDMSAVLGTDLTSSVIRVGRALEDPIRGMERLERISVTFSQEQKDQIRLLAESNKLFEAQEVILDELESRFEGAAKAIGDTFGKQVDILGFQLRNVGEDIFEFFVPAMLEMVGSLRLSVNWLEATVKALQDLKDEINFFDEGFGKGLVKGFVLPFQVMADSVILSIAALTFLEQKLEGLEVGSFKEFLEVTRFNIAQIFKSATDDVDGLNGAFGRFNDTNKGKSSAGQRTPLEQLAKDISAAAFKEDTIQEDQLKVQKETRDAVRDIATTGGVAGPGFALG